MTALVHAYAKQLYRTGRGLGLDHDSTEEAVQSTFLTLLESAERFEGRSSTRTWLFGIFLNKVREHWKEIRRAGEQEAIDEVIESRFDTKGRWLQPPEDIEARIAASEFRVFLNACLEALPPLQRSAFHLREVEEMSTEEICKILEVSTTHCGVVLHRARHRLRECLEAKGIRRG